MEIFCERLKELRANRKLSAKKLGKELDVSDSTIIRWENGLRVPSIDSLYSLARFFDVSSDYLIGFED